jgi:hypothetical protein
VTVARRLALIALLAFAAWLLWILGEHLGPLSERRFRRVLALALLSGVAIVGWIRPVSTTAKRAMLAVVLGCLCVGFVAQTYERPRNIGNHKQVAEWGVFHYYLGSKYFPELQFTRLYEQAWIADSQRDKPNFGAVPRIRDLESYEFIDVKQLRGKPRDAVWSDERWAAFSRDVGCLGRMARGKRWQKILGDRGYNPPPSYTLVASIPNSILSICSPAAQTVLVFLDVLLLLLATAIGARAYGWVRSTLVLSAFVLWYGATNRLFGQIWIFDWFAACWLAVSAWKLGWHKTSGGLLAYATMMRVWPAVMGVGLVLGFLPRIVRERRIPAELQRFVAAGVAVALALGALSGLRYGPKAWGDFAHNITVHNEEHTLGSRRFGLKQLFVLDWQNRLRTRPENVRGGTNMRANKGRYNAARAVFLLLGLVAMLRQRDPHDAMLLGVVIFFSATVASRYYGVVSVLLLLLGLGRAGEHDLRAGPRILMDVGLLAILAAFYGSQIDPKEPRVEFLWSNAMWAAWWLASLAWLVFRESEDVPEEADAPEVLPTANAPEPLPATG